jgi:DNA-binding Lrp family transcriptional regulator
MDDLDQAILTQLQQSGRASITELARRIDLSPPATHARIRHLEAQGIIRQYTALLDRERVGYDMLCFVSVTLRSHTPEQVEEFRSAIQAMPEVLECHHVTGEYDYLLKVVIRNRRDLERFLVRRLTPVAGGGRIHTSLVLTEVKNTTEVPIGDPK